MTLLEERPQADHRMLPTRGDARLLLRVAAIVGAVAGVIAVTVAVDRAMLYEPLSATSARPAPADPFGRPLERAAVLEEDTSTPFARGALVRYEGARNLYVLFELHNEGSRAVRVTSVESGWHIADVRAVQMGDASLLTERRHTPRGHVSGPIALVPFEPFGLEGGDTRLIAVLYRFKRGCDVATPGSFSAPTVRVGYKFAMFSHEVTASAATWRAENADCSAS